MTDKYLNNIIDENILNKRLVGSDCLFSLKKDKTKQYHKRFFQN